MLVKSVVYDHPDSPYLKLLKWLGCEYGDLQKLVAENGVEGTLHNLMKQGLYIKVDEFKGRSPLQRGSFRIKVDPACFRNPRTSSHILIQSGGSRGPRTPIGIDLASIREHAYNLRLLQEARKGEEWQYAIWGVPGSSAMRILLRFACAGFPPLKWFSQIGSRAEGLHSRYFWSARVMRWGSLLARVPLPEPEHVSISNPEPIIHWIEGIFHEGKTPHILTFVSSATSLCQAAGETGISFTGVKFLITGEPITRTSYEIIGKAGAEIVAHYGATEAGGPVGFGCLSPDEPDDMHLLHDIHALIQPGEDVQIPGIPSHGLLLSSLRRHAPLILLNVSLGDQAFITRRPCGCSLQQLGWITHLHTIRSYEKLTCGGMALLDKDIIHVLEEILPARFGGAPTDYQLLEEEGAAGSSRLRLLVHPRLGELDTGVVLDTFLDSIGRGSGVEHLAELLWRDSRILEVVREAPRTTASGKILHMHFDRYENTD